MINYSQNLHDVTAEILLPENYNLQDQSKKIQQVQSSTPVTWDIVAPIQKDNTKKVATVNVTYYETGTVDQISLNDTVSFKSVTKARLVLASTIDNGTERRLTIGQPFEIKAIVSNLGDAAVVGTARLTINFGTTKCELDPNDNTNTSVKDFTQNQPIVWKAIAPTVPTKRAPIIVTISSIPMDENSGIGATIPFGITDTVYVETEEGGAITNTLEIESPVGATDLILSTYQQFTIKGQITTYGVDAIKSTLLLPAGFNFIASEEAVKDIQNGSGTKIVRWGVIAPKDSIYAAVIKIFTTARDVNSHESVFSDTTGMSVQVVERAGAAIAASIVSPLQATDGVVSTGQLFRIEVNLDNYGAARMTGEYGVKITVPSGYSIGGSDTKTGDVSSSIYWDILAPGYQTPLANIIIGVVTGTEPDDENTNEPVYFVSGAQSKSIPIMTIQRSVNVLTYTTSSKIVVATGEQNVALLGLEFFNSEEDQIANEMVLKGMRLSIRDKDGKLLEDPSKAISRIAVAAHENRSHLFGEVTEFTSGGLITIHFVEPDTIYPATRDSIDILVDISERASVENFMCQIDSTSSLSIEEAYTTIVPVIRDEYNNTGTNFRIRSDFITLMSNNFEDSFGNYPNPFGSSGKSETKFTYFLKKNTAISIKIYTLLGDLVWSRSYKATDVHGSAGSHDGNIVWDGRNDNGNMVLNGVYIAYISTDDGEKAITKIAVLK